MASPLFSSASVTISALSFSSTYILRSRAFSASSSFMRAISDTVHAAILGTPLAERSRADAQLSAQLRNGKAGLHALDGFNDLAIRKSRLLHAVELLNEKILLLTSSLLRGDCLVSPQAKREAVRTLMAERSMGVIPLTISPTELPPCAKLAQRSPAFQRSGVSPPRPAQCGGSSDRPSPTAVVAARRHANVPTPRVCLPAAPS